MYVEYFCGHVCIDVGSARVFGCTHPVMPRSALICTMCLNMCLHTVRYYRYHCYDNGMITGFDTVLALDTAIGVNEYVLMHIYTRMPTLTCLHTHKYSLSSADDALQQTHTNAYTGTERRHPVFRSGVLSTPELHGVCVWQGHHQRWLCTHGCTHG